jgi:GntR family transcriptional regulator
VRIKLDHDRGIPLYRQIYEAVARGLGTGVLAPGEQLPTIHQLASELRVNPNTVARSYRDLERDGHISAQRGRGTFAAPRPTASANARANAQESVLRDLFDRSVHEAGLHGITPREIADYFHKAVEDET